MSAFIWSMYYVKESNALLLNSNTTKRRGSRFVAKIFWDAYKKELLVSITPQPHSTRRLTRTSQLSKLKTSVSGELLRLAATVNKRLNSRRINSNETLCCIVQSFLIMRGSSWLICFVILVIAGFGCGPSKLPSDQSLIQRFETRRDSFEKLLEMFKSDRSLGRVAYDFTRTASFFERCEGADAWNGKEIEVSNSRLREYRSLFSELELSAGIEGYCQKDFVTFIGATQGLSISGSSKGFAYIEKPPKLIVEDLDSYFSEDRRSFIAFRRIEGNWYLYRDFED